MSTTHVRTRQISPASTLSSRSNAAAAAVPPLHCVRGAPTRRHGQPRRHATPAEVQPMPSTHGQAAVAELMIKPMLDDLDHCPDAGFERLNVHADLRRSARTRAGTVPHHPGTQARSPSLPAWQRKHERAGTAARPGRDPLPAACRLDVSRQRPGSSGQPSVSWSGLTPT